MHGCPGSGRRLLALWWAARQLGIPAARLARFATLEIGAEVEGDLGHPDFMFVQPPPGKAQISVASVRALIEFLHLKSHQGGARVAVVWPGDAMTLEAANSLLKTLEEPPSGGLIVLVAATAAGLPATVVSRCQRLAIHAPPRGIAMEWLRSRAGDAEWDMLLDIAGGAPFRALDLHRNDFSGTARQLAEDVRDLASGRTSPVPVGQRWAGFDGELVTQWLYWMLARAIRATSGPPDKPLQMAGKALTMPMLLQRLADVEDLRRSGTKAVRAELQYAAMLQRWYG